MSVDEFVQWLGLWGLMINTIGIMFGVEPDAVNKKTE